MCSPRRKRWKWGGVQETKERKGSVSPCYMVDTEKATVFAIAEKNTAVHSPFLPLAVLRHQLDVVAALASSLLS